MATADILAGLAVLAFAGTLVYAFWEIGEEIQDERERRANDENDV